MLSCVNEKALKVGVVVLGVALTIGLFLTAPRIKGCASGALKMNIELFTAFLLITVVLIIAPGPIVTLVISTGATRGVRAALTTVAGTSAWQRLTAGGDRAAGSTGCTRMPICCSPPCAGPARPI